VPSAEMSGLSRAYVALPGATRLMFIKKLRLERLWGVVVLTTGAERPGGLVQRESIAELTLG